jgi:16S rRNA A1518/A1519 N6-dimethyltransferase RsmA/KsgA/DIM1 with predicted DNA glycosylase/AP lyase activity
MKKERRTAFNEVVLTYDKTRPTYVKELFDDVIQFSGLDSGKKALEIGIGTGQATLPFLKTGCKITAIEIGEDLAEFSREKFAEFNNFNVINKDFESVTVGDSTYDLCYSASAFHWIPQKIGYPKALGIGAM